MIQENNGNGNKCRLCSIIKPISEFQIRNNTTQNRRNECKQCISDYGKIYRDSRKDYYSLYDKQKFIKNRKRILEHHAEWRKKNPSYSKEYWKKSRPKIKEKNLSKKKCSLCNLIYPIKSFRITKRSRHSWCKSCYKNKIHEYYTTNKLKISESNKKYRQNHKDKIKKRRKEYYCQNRIHILNKHQEYFQKNKNKILKRIKTHYQQNRIQIIQRANQYQNKRIKHDIVYRLLFNLRRRVRSALKNNSKSKSTRELIGCTISYLKKHLENQFKVGMSWDNYGFFGWHIDHIIPCVSFNLTYPKQQQNCFNYTNLQPLWWHENLSKGGKNVKQNKT